MIISLNGVSKVYKDGESEVQALDEVTFTIKRGEFVAITGPSGSGKSTLMNILACFEQPTSGSYTIDGQKIEFLGNKTSAMKLKRKIGFVSQNFYFLPRMSVLQNISLALLFEGNNKLERYERAACALKTVGLDHCMKHRPSILTVAQRQQVAIARTIIHDPDIVLADEPTVNLQPELSYEIRNALRRLNRQGRTVIVVTRDPGILRQAQRIIAVRSGRIVRDGQ